MSGVTTVRVSTFSPQITISSPSRRPLSLSLCCLSIRCFIALLLLLVFPLTHLPPLLTLHLFTFSMHRPSVEDRGISFRLPNTPSSPLLPSIARGQCRTRAHGREGERERERERERGSASPRALSPHAPPASLQRKRGERSWRGGNRW